LSNPSKIALVFFLYATFANADVIHRGEIADSIAAKPDTEKVSWVSAEYGIHSQDFDRGDFGTGTYGNISCELAFVPRLSLLVRYERVRFGSFHNNFGLGVSFTYLKDANWDFAIAPSIYVGNNLGLMFPIMVSYRVFDNKFRLQASVSYHREGELGPAGHTGLSFYTASIGFGISLNKFLPQNRGD
jgi:hypothetical protein